MAASDNANDGVANSNSETKDGGGDDDGDSSYSDKRDDTTVIPIPVGRNLS